MTKPLNEAIKRLKRLPDDRQEILAKFLLHAIDISEQQIASGQTLTHEEAKQRLEKWLSPPV